MKKGFTLVELIATIVILSIVITLSVGALSRYTNSLRKKQHDSLINKIETAASKYAFDTSKELVFVQELIDNGYYELNDDEEKIIDPENNETLNCYVVEMEKQGNYYVANFLKDSKFELANGSCDTNKLNISDDSIRLQVYIKFDTESSYRPVDPAYWQKGDEVSLSVNTIQNSVDCNKNECLWLSSSGLREEGSIRVDFKVGNVSKTKYTFQYSVIDGEKVTRKSKTIELKIDNEKPILRSEDVIVEDRFIPSENKKVIIDATDGNGSGIIGYYLGTATNCNSVAYQQSNEFTISSKGNYLICVKDKVGNVNYINYAINDIELIS